MIVLAQRLFRSRYLVIVVTALLGTLASIGAALLVLSWEHRVAEIDFQSKARSYLEVINSELDDARTLLYTLGAYMDTNEHPVSRRQFQRFTQALNSRVVGVRNIGWAPLVTRLQRRGFEREVLAAAGIPHHDRILERNARRAMVPARDRAVYYPMVYVQAGAEFGNTALRSLLGFDVASEPLRLAAIERTVAAGRPAATPPLRIIGVRGAVGGVVAFNAVGGSHRSHGDTRRPRGLVLAAFEIAPMVKNIIAEKLHESGMDLYLFDPARSLDHRRIYSYSSAIADSSLPTESVLRASMHWQSTVTLIDQHWGAIVTPTTPLRSKSGIAYALVTLATGLAMTAVLVAFLLVSVRRSIKLEGLTASLRASTEDLHRNTEVLSRNSRQIAHMARHDALTGLANRLVFRERIEEAITRRRRGEPFALFYLDLDHFKYVNDTLGHSAGDQLLCVVAERISSCLRAGDTVARLGGDEFAIVLANAESPESVAQVAERLINSVSMPLSIDGQLVVASVSIGIALAADNASAETLLKEADLALYEAKDAGRRTYRFFESRLRLQIEAKRALEGDLRRGLERSEFEVYYQPIVNIARSRVTAFEALVRWNHPEQGLLAPGQFIAFAEECGFIAELGSWVLRTACEQAARWPQPVKVAVNISPLQFKDENLVADLSHCLALSGLPAQRLEIEITEAAVLQESAHTKAALDSLRAMGVTIALDDFGTGFSSLSSLLRFPFDKLKIDRSFVAAVKSSESASAIVRAIVGLGGSLNLVTTGEGVETPEQLADLRRLGCAEAQGYLFSRPRPNSEVPRLLHELNLDAQERIFAIGA
jgi:diguanylate cyclase (GGDEF)-like protein